MRSLGTVPFLARRTPGRPYVRLEGYPARWRVDGLSGLVATPESPGTNALRGHKLALLNCWEMREPKATVLLG